MKQISLFCALCMLLTFSRHAIAQCSVISGTSGILNNSTNTESVTYSVAVYGGCSIANNGLASLCGFNFPAIQAPYTGASFATGTVVYAFSGPVSKIDLFIAAAGITATYTAVEGFTFNTNGSVPVLMVNSGSCIPWTVMGNEITSPNAQNAFNAIVTISCAIPFSTLSISNGPAGFVHGGSGYGFCETSLVTGMEKLRAETHQFNIYSVPENGQLVVEGNVPIQLVEVYNSHGRQLFSKQVNAAGTTLDLKFLSAGIYIIVLYTEKGTIVKKILHS
jgi:hypothetical protein